MTGVRVQYVYDENGRRTGVIIPAALWNEVKSKMEMGEKGEVVNPSEYRGIYKDLGTDLEKEARSLRGEWIRRRCKIKLPDVVIAATALHNNLILVTRNEDDFKDVELLDVYNPFR